MVGKVGYRYVGRRKSVAELDTALKRALAKPPKERAERDNNHGPQNETICTTSVLVRVMKSSSSNGCVIIEHSEIESITIEPHLSEI